MPTSRHTKNLKSQSLSNDLPSIQASQLTKQMTVAVSYFKALLDFCVEEYSLSRSYLLSQSGLSETDLNDPQQRIAAERYNHLMITAAEQSDDSLLGQNFGAQLGTSAFNILGYLAMSAATLGEAALALQKYEELVSNIGSTTIKHNGATSQMCWQPNQHNNQLSHHIVEAVFSGWISFGRKIIGFAAPINRIYFCHSKPESSQDNQSLIFDCPVLYNQAINAIEIDKKWLSLPLTQSQQAVYQALLLEAQKAIEKIGQASNSFTHQIQSLIINNLYQGSLSLDNIASQLNVSRRTLQRQLKQQQVNFRDLVEQTKKELAIKLVIEDSLPLTSIAGILGFSEQSGFTRAYKRWTGHSPKEYREVY